MTREEAIKFYADEILLLELAPTMNGGNGSSMEAEWKRQAEIHRMAIAALREKLPCKIGDTLYGIRRFYNGMRVLRGKVSEMYYGDEMRLCIVLKNACRGEFGKTIFLTREEAYEAMRRMEEA